MLAALIAKPKTTSPASPSTKLAPQHSTLMGHSLGNGAAELRHISRPLPGPIQPKLVVGKVDDPFEQEADRIADTVMSAPVSAPVTPAPLRISRKCAACEEDEEEKAQTLQMKLERAQQTISSENLAGVRETIRSPGKRLDPATRAFFEPRFGHDFGRVQVHSDAASAQSARQIGALAYTVESHVVFGGGQYAPESSSGQRLLAHELVHVIQQDSAPKETTKINDAMPALRAPNQTGTAPAVTGDMEQMISSSAGKGQPLPAPARAFFEGRFGHDFSRVRVHDDSSAAEISGQLDAEAFTLHNDIFFNRGRYNPNRPDGRHLLAHELTHVIQQSSGTPSHQVQRAKIPYRPLVWSDFQKAAPPGSTFAAETASGFTVPAWNPVRDAQPTGKDCTLNKKPAKEFTATVSIAPTAFDSIAAQMTQEQSWVKDQYKTPAGNVAFCKTVKGPECEAEFGTLTKQAVVDCDPQPCLDFFKAQNGDYKVTVGGVVIVANSASDCPTQAKSCRDENAKGFKFSMVDDEKKVVTTAVTKAECSAKAFQAACVAHEAAESAWLLKHEQGHFDITNVMAPKAKADLQAKAATFKATATACGKTEANNAAVAKFDALDAPAKLSQLGKDWVASKDKAETDYDNDTDHGLIRANQATWETTIKTGLTAYDLNAPPPGSTAAPGATTPTPTVTAPTTPPPPPSTP